jgi:hypothetical protein
MRRRAMLYLPLEIDVGERLGSMSWAGTEIGVWLALGTVNQQDGSFDVFTRT